MAVRSALLPVDQENGGHLLLVVSVLGQEDTRPPLLHPLGIDHGGPATTS